MSIKLKYLCLVHRKHPDQAHLWMTAGRKKLTQRLWRLIGTRKCLTLLPFLLVQKEPQARWFFRGKPPSWFAGFLNKVAISCLNNPPRFTGLSCSEQYEIGLGNTATPLTMWLLCEALIHVISNPHSNPARQGVVSPFSRWDSWYAGRLRTCSNLIQLLNGKGRILNPDLAP